jgi:hypothetical protein
VTVVRLCLVVTETLLEESLWLVEVLIWESLVAAEALLLESSSLAELEMGRWLAVVEQV